MRNLIIFISLFFSVLVSGQSRDDFFIESANLYLKDKISEALELVNEGLYNFPKDKKLEALKKKLEEEEKKKNQNQKNKSDSQKDNQKNTRERDNPKPNQQEKDSSEEDRGEVQRFNEDLQKELLNNTLKKLQQEEMKIKQRMIRKMGKREFKHKEKDW